MKEKHSEGHMLRLYVFLSDKRGGRGYRISIINPRSGIQKFFYTNELTTDIDERNVPFDPPLDKIRCEHCGK